MPALLKEHGDDFSNTEYGVLVEFYFGDPIHPINGLSAMT
jgi:hypothetical protein